MKIRVDKAWEAEHYHEKATFTDARLTVVVRETDPKLTPGVGAMVHFLFDNIDDKQKGLAAWSVLAESMAEYQPELLIEWLRKKGHLPGDEKRRIFTP